MDLPVPHLSYEDLRAKADATLAKYASPLQIPVPIEQILEFAFNVTIIPLPGLQVEYEIDAFMSKDGRTVYVDHSVMEHRSPNRYRFSLAHELGHIVLHQAVLASISFSSAAGWKRAMLAMPEPDREWVEWQASCFAGLMLVPRKPLKEKLRKGIERATKARFSIKNNDEVAKGYVCTWLGREFEVSSQVVARRLDKDKLWPPP